MRKSLKIFILSACWRADRRERTTWALILALTATALLYSIFLSAAVEAWDLRSWVTLGALAGVLAAVLSCLATLCIMFICAIERDRMRTCLTAVRTAAAAWPDWEDGTHPAAGPYRRTRKNGTIIGIYARDDTPTCSIAVICGDTVDYTSHVEPEQAPALALRKADETAGRENRNREKGRKKDARRELKTARATARDDRVREEQSKTMDRLRQATREQAEAGRNHEQDRKDPKNQTGETQQCLRS